MTTTYPISEVYGDRFDNDFTYHAPFGDQPMRYELNRDFAKSFALMLARNCPPSRELSLAFTKIDEAVFWANAAIARNEKRPIALCSVEEFIDNTVEPIADEHIAQAWEYAEPEEV